MNLSDSIAGKRVIICGGSGGVGKTTMSAALGFYLARQGKRAVVITINPARRLADALGISMEPGKMVEVPLPAPSAGTLHAVMLEPLRVVESFMQKLLHTAGNDSPIVSERFFQQGMAMLAASPEYLALQELYELSRRPGVDVIVLDTPPTRQSVDFLTAPNRLLKVIQEKSVVVNLARPYLTINRVGFNLIKVGAKPILNIIDRIFGIQTFIEFFTFFDACVTLLDLDGLERRVRRVNALLRDAKTTFLVVSAPNPVSIEEALYLHSKISSFHIAFGGFIINRVQPLLSSGEEELQKSLELAGRIREEFPEYPALATALPRLIGNLEDHLSLRLREQNEIARLAAVLSDDQCLAQMPRLEYDVHDVAGIGEMAAAIT